MKVQKTGKAQICKTLAHGTIVLWETFYECAADIPCRHSSGDLATQRAKVTESLIPKRQVGYDVMTFIGTRRYIEYQQRDEILEALEKEGVSIAAGSESDLVKLFSGYLRVLHDDPETIRKLRRELDADGGYWVHVDATCENGRGTTVAVYAGKRHWVLDVAKISTENANEILVVLRRVVECFGIPLAIMSDMGRGVLGAIRNLREELGTRADEIVQLICHLHYIRDLGKDILKAPHNALGKAATFTKIKARLRVVERDLTELIGDKETAREQVNSWVDEQSSTATLKPLPSGIQGLSILRSLVQWTLDYRVEANDDFPFSRPNLDFYGRCQKARVILNGYRENPPIGAKLQAKLDRIHKLINEFCSDEHVLPNVERLNSRLALWEELRVALRIVPEGTAKSRTHLPKEVPTEQAKVELQDIQSAINKLCDSYRACRSAVSQDLQGAIDIILCHMEKYDHLLWGHIIKLPDGRTVVLERTNNPLENLWGDDKHGERRRSGHKTLTHDLETKPADAFLAHNLSCPDYVRLSCGTLENLPRVFAQMDAELRQKALAQPKTLDPKDLLPRTVSELLASMSSEETDRAQDRKLIRSKEYAAQIKSVSQAQPTVPTATSVPATESVAVVTSSPPVATIATATTSAAGTIPAMDSVPVHSTQMSFQAFT